MVTLDVPCFTVELFNAAARVSIDGYADMCYFPRASIRKDIRRLVRAGIVDKCEQYGDALSFYHQVVEAYGVARLPAGYFPARCYWGSRCFMRETDSSQDKSLPLSGDTCGHYRTFTGWAAMEQYVDDLLKRLEG